MNKDLAHIPYLGVGIGLRTSLIEETLRHTDEIDVLEIIAEKFFPSRYPHTLPALERFSDIAVVPHGLKLSIGSAIPLSERFLSDMKELCAGIHAPYYSDHFALTRLGGELDTGHLSPLWYTKETLEYLVKKIDGVQQKIGLPLVLENITAELVLTEADYEEPEFITEVCRRTGCGLLLDLTNIHINAYNRGTDALTLLQRYPMNHVVQVHLAGGEIHRGVFKDTHSQELMGPNEGVWELLKWASVQAQIKALIIERDENFKENFEEMILVDLRRARSIIEKKTERGEHERLV